MLYQLKQLDNLKEKHISIFSGYVGGLVNAPQSVRQPVSTCPSLVELNLSMEYLTPHEWSIIAFYGVRLFTHRCTKTRSVSPSACRGVRNSHKLLSVCVCVCVCVLVGANACPFTWPEALHFGLHVQISPFSQKQRNKQRKQ